MRSLRAVANRLTFTPADALFWAGWLALVAIFAALSFWAHRRYFWPGDLRLTIWVQDLHSHRVPVAENVFRVANAMGDLEVIGALLVALIALSAIQRLWLEAAIFAGAGAMRWVHLGVRALVDRPQENPDPPPPPELYPNSGSFPSGHVFGEVLVYGLLFALAPRIIRDHRIVAAIRILAAAEIIAGAPARMYTGAHWPSDLVGAAILAMLYILPALWLDRKLTPNDVRATASTRASDAPAELPPDRATPTIEA